MALCTLCLALLAALLFAVAAGATVGVDRWIGAAFQPVRSPALVSTFVALTSLGSGGALAATVLALSALLWGLDRKRRLAAVWVTFAGAEATTWTLKYLVGRSRPATLAGVGTAISPSFPSGHTTGTTALVGILAAVIIAEVSDQRTRIRVLWVAVATVAIIGFSRIFLNQHFFSDVVGGYLVAAFWLLIGSTGLRPHAEANQETNTERR